MTSSLYATYCLRGRTFTILVCDAELPGVIPGPVAMFAIEYSREFGYNSWLSMCVHITGDTGFSLERSYKCVLKLKKNAV